MSTEWSIYPRTQLYTLRLWMEPSNSSQGAVRMRVSHVLSGESRYFTTWPDAVTFMLSLFELAIRNNLAKRGFYHDV